jgi:Uma2 family endonuclease
VTFTDRLAELGFFGEDDRVELIKGEIITMAAKGTRHSTFNRRLIRELSKLIGDRTTLQSQDPVVISTHSDGLGNRTTPRVGSAYKDSDEVSKIHKYCPLYNK